MGKHSALLRLHKDIAALQPMHGIRIEHCPQDAWSLMVLAKPQEGYYSSAGSGDPGFQYVFRLTVGVEYPFEPPSVRCVVPVGLYHPNVHPVSGEVCMDLLLDWGPIMSLTGVLDALLGVLEEPECFGGSVVNSEAAQALQQRPQEVVGRLQELQEEMRQVRCWQMVQEAQAGLGRADQEEESEEEERQCGVKRMMERGEEPGGHKRAIIIMDAF